MMVVGNEVWGIVFFELFLLVLISLVSIHYRRKYEQIKAVLLGERKGLEGFE